MSASSTVHAQCTLHIECHFYTVLCMHNAHQQTICFICKKEDAHLHNYTYVQKWFPASCRFHTDQFSGRLRSAVNQGGSHQGSRGGGSGWQGGGSWGLSVHWCWHRIGSPASTISCCFSAPGVGIRMQLLNTAGTATHIFASFLAIFGRTLLLASIFPRMGAVVKR